MNKTEKEFDSLMDFKFKFNINISKLRKLWPKRKKKRKK